MNRQDIADYLGLKPETVSRAFKVLEAEGVLSRRGPRGLVLHHRRAGGAAPRPECAGSAGATPSRISRDRGRGAEAALRARFEAF
jgi:DNA-binding transcriptional MocR family regulator